MPSALERIVGALLPGWAQLRTDVNALQQEVRRMTSRQEEFDAKVNETVERFNNATNELAKDIKELRDQVQAGTIDPSAAFTKFNAIAARLEELGADPTNPVPGGDSTGSEAGQVNSGTADA